jgi:hypothetical protein
MVADRLRHARPERAQAMKMFLSKSFRCCVSATALILRIINKPPSAGGYYAGWHLINMKNLPFI